MGMTRKREPVSLTVRFGERVRELRESRGWIQTDLAYHSRLERAFISRIENGRTNVSLETAERLAAVFEITAEELFRGL